VRASRAGSAYASRRVIDQSSSRRADWIQIAWGGQNRRVTAFTGASPFVPASRGLAAMRAAAAECRGCDLWSRGTQVVFGEGPLGAEMVLVGEAPGDREDVEGRPFVGPAGRVLDDALERACIDRSRVYLTNAVKHFRWKEGGRRRLHERPLRSHVVACRPWLRAELDIVSPRLVVLMGAIAAQSLLGAEFSVMRRRGVVHDAPADLPKVVAAVHPSSILRAPDAVRPLRMEEFVEDLRVAAALL
jgi:uracil-DNA glycosylase family protein